MLARLSYRASGSASTLYYISEDRDAAEPPRPQAAGWHWHWH
jgi:hypothetical protein